MVRLTEHRRAKAIQQKVNEKRKAFMNLIDHFKDANSKKRIFAEPFISKNNKLIKKYLSHKTQLDTIIDTYTKNCHNAYQLLPPLIKECLGVSNKQRAKEIYENTLAKYPVIENNYGIYNIYIYILL